MPSIGDFTTLQVSCSENLVATIELARGTKSNALNNEMWDEIPQVHLSAYVNQKLKIVYRRKAQLLNGMFGLTGILVKSQALELLDKRDDVRVVCPSDLACITRRRLQDMSLQVQLYQTCMNVLLRHRR